MIQTYPEQMRQQVRMLEAQGRTVEKIRVAGNLWRGATRGRPSADVQVWSTPLIEDPALPDGVAIVDHDEGHVLMRLEAVTF